ncbi:CDC27 protein [Coemansia sp. RSA 720]|nr:CDC27 protein [Coemansia sp. RSA 720]
MSSANEVLNSLVSLEAQIVTYRRLSRELKVHVNTAKQLLAEFHDVHKDRCQATFLVTGTKKSEGGSELSVKLVAGSELDAAQQELDNSYYHVYSVGPRVDVTKEAMIIANVLAGSIQDIAEHCAVGSSVSRVINSAPVSAPKPATPAAAMSVDKPVVKSEPKPQVSKQEANKQEPTKQAAKKQEPKQQAATPKSKSFFGRSIGAKKSSKKEPESQTSEDSSAQSKPEYSFAESKTDESSVEPAIEESSAQSNPVDSTSSEEKPRVEDMFMDDDDFEMSPVKPKEPQTPNESMDTQTDSDYPCKESSDVEMGDAEDDDSSVRESESQSMQPDELQTSSGRRRVRKRRKISKVKHTKNSRGMLVSQAVDEWESYSESESDSGANAHTSLVKQKADKSNEHKPAVKKPADKGNKAVPQRSILSFFGKSSKQ